MDLLCFCSVFCLLCLCARLFNCALWSPAGKGLTSCSQGAKFLKIDLAQFSSQKRFDFRNS